MARHTRLKQGSEFISQGELTGHRGGDGTTYCTVCGGGAMGAMGIEKEVKSSKLKTSLGHREDQTPEVAND